MKSLMLLLKLYHLSANDVLNFNTILTKWEDFKKLDYKGKIVIDGERLKEAETAKIYEGDLLIIES